MTTIAERLGDYVAAADLAEVPASVREKAKLCILDSLGCIVGGTAFPAGRQVVEMVASWGGFPQASIAACGPRVPAPWAAYTNGYLANLLDADDTVPMGHPGASIVPTALALSEWRHCSGLDLLAAVLVGYEIALRVAAAVRPSHAREAYVRGMGTWQIFGAAAVASRLLGLGAQQSAHALALAVNHAPVPCMKKFGHQERPISWIKNNLGWANLGGVLAAQEAAAGMTGNLRNFEGQTGFWIMAGADEPHFEAYTEGLSEVYRIMEVALKPYPACWGPHTTLDAVDTLVQRHDIRAADVRRIVVSGARYLANFADPAPQTITDAQFSIPYGVAMLLLRQPPGHQWFTEENLGSPEVITLAGKVAFEEDAEAEARQSYLDLARPVHVRIELSGGHWVEERGDICRGDSRRPMTWQDTSDKFLRLAGPVLGQHRAERLVELVSDLERLNDAAGLAQLFGKED